MSDSPRPDNLIAVINGAGVEYRVVLNEGDDTVQVHAIAGPAAVVMHEDIEYLKALDWIRNEIAQDTGGQRPEEAGVHHYDDDNVLVNGQLCPIVSTFELMGVSYVTYRMWGGETGIARIA